MTNLSNSTAISAAFVDLAKAHRSHKERMAKLVKPLADAKVSAADLKPGGLYYDMLIDGVAQAYLSPTEYKIWADTSLATSVKGEKTERGKLQPRVTSNVSKVRNAILEACGLTGKKKKESSAPRTATQIFFDTMDEFAVKLSADDASDKYEFDPRLARDAIIAMVKTLK